MENEEMNFSDSSQEPEKKENLVEKFDRERKEWTSKVEHMSEGIRDIYNCTDMLTEGLSNRQIALEYSHTLMGVLSKINAELREKRKERYLYYTQSYDLKLDKDPKNMFIDVDLKKQVMLQELFQNHLNFIRGTIDTIDKLIWGIKWRLSLEDYRRTQH